MNGSITQRGDSFSVSFTTRGKRIRRQFPSMTQAEGYLLDLRRAVIAGKQLPQPEGSGQTWGELREATIQSVWRGAKSMKTQLINSKMVVDFFGADSLVESFNQEVVDALVKSLQEKGNSNATINRKLTALNKMVHHGMDLGWIAPNIRFKITFYKEKKGRVRILSADEELQVLKMAPPKLKNLFVFLLYSGCRVSEALNLRWTDFNWSAPSVTFWDTKSGESRTIPLTLTLVKLLNEEMERMDKGLEGPFAHIKQFEINRGWDRIRIEMGLQDDEEFVPHCMRHTRASRFVQKGVPIVVVKEWLGHKTIQMTMRYAHLAPTNLNEALKTMEES